MKFLTYSDFKKGEKQKKLKFYNSIPRLFLPMMIVQPYPSAPFRNIFVASACIRQTWLEDLYNDVFCTNYQQLLMRRKQLSQHCYFHFTSLSKLRARACGQRQFSLCPKISYPRYCLLHFGHFHFLILQIVFSIPVTFTFTFSL